MTGSVPRTYRGYTITPRYSGGFPAPHRPRAWGVTRPDGSPVGAPRPPGDPGFPTLDDARRAVRRDLGIENEGDRRRWAGHPALAGTRAVVAL